MQFFILFLDYRMAEWSSMFQDMETYIARLAELERNASIEEAADVIVVLDTYISAVSGIIQRITESGFEEDEGVRDLSRDLTELLEALQHILSVWIDKEAGITNTGRDQCVPSGIQVYRSGYRGRPKLIVPTQSLLLLRELHFSWTRIAKLFGISRRTLFSIRQNLGFEEIDPARFSNISDSQLQEQISSIKRFMPDAGMRMVRGVLRSQGISVPIVRIREALYVVDPLGTSLRWATVVKRRQYSVTCPNALWHIDGNHKLIR